MGVRGVLLGTGRASVGSQGKGSDYESEFLSHLTCSLQTQSGLPAKGWGQVGRPWGPGEGNSVPRGHPTLPHACERPPLAVPPLFRADLSTGQRGCPLHSSS